MSVPAGTWLYALETVSLTAPTRGVVVKAGGRLNRCDVIYHVYADFEEGESWDTVWRRGELLTYEEGGDPLTLAVRAPVLARLRRWFPRKDPVCWSARGPNV